MYLGFVLIRYANICRYGNDYHEREDFTYSSLETEDSHNTQSHVGRQKEQRKAWRRAFVVGSMGRNGRGRVSRFRIG